MSPDYVPTTKPSVPNMVPSTQKHDPEGHSKRGIFEDVLKGDDLVSDNERYDIKPRVSVRERR